MISYARTVTFWVPLLCLMLSCTLTAHALSVHADSQLSAEGHELCFNPPTDLSKFAICCTCDNLQEAHEHAQHAKRYYEAHKKDFAGAMHWGVMKQWIKYQKEHLRVVEKSYNMVKACLADFKKKSCAPGTAPYQTASPSNQCSKNTGGTCRGWSSCDSSRKASCVNGKCVCGAGKCAIGGKCVSMTGAPRTGHGRRLLLDPTNEDEFLLDEGATTDLQSSVKEGFGACPTWGIY